MKLDRDLAIGIDLGATKVAAALVSRRGAVLASCQAPTEPSNGPEAVLDRIAGQIRELAQEGEGAIRGVGIGSPGQVDPRRGSVRAAINLGWEEVDLVSGLKQRLGLDLPIWIQKDANANALGEYFFGAAQGCPDFVYIGIGSGLGGGIMAGGRLINGAGIYAAELGHYVLDPGGLPCACGQRGCAETIVSGLGLLALAQRIAHGRPPEDFPLDLDRLTTAQVIEMARAGNAVAAETMLAVGQALGQVMAACAAVLNPARIVIGGGLGAAAFEWIVPPARAELERRVLRITYGNLEIVKSSLASSAVGAACLAWYCSE